MHRIVLLMAVLMKSIAPHTNETDPPDLDTNQITMSTLIPTVFRSEVRLTAKPRRPQMRQGKADSPMLNYIFDSYATSNKHFHDNKMFHLQYSRYFPSMWHIRKMGRSVYRFRAPSFEGDVTSEDTVIDADTGSTVVFDCRVSSLRDKMVSWIRVSETDKLELLTLDLDTHTADIRYRVDLAGENWKLSLSDAKIQDSGVYCCHVSTHPPMLRRFKLIVHEPEIKMTKEAFLESGETLSLKCAVIHLNTGESVPEMRWYRGNNTVSLDEIRGGVLVETDHMTLTSHLQVVRVKAEDAGNYTCALEAPLHMRAVARVHVLQGSSLAELQSGVKTTTSYLSLLLTMLVVLGTWYGDVR